MITQEALRAVTRIYTEDGEDAVSHMVSNHPGGEWHIFNFAYCSGKVAVYCSQTSTVLFFYRENGDISLSSIIEDPLTLMAFLDEIAINHGK
jgi:hypothetical protein